MENQASLLEQMTVILWLVEWVSIIELERVKTKEISNSEQGSSHEYFFFFLDPRKLPSFNEKLKEGWEPQS